MNTPFARTVLLALLGGSGLLSACATPDMGPQPTNPLALTPTEQYSVELVPATDEILLAPHGALSPGQTAALGEMVMRWREGGEDAIVVEGPAAGPANGTALAAAEMIKAYGAPAVLRLGGPSADAAPAPVRVSFARVEAVIPDCSNRWGELTRTRENKPHAGFGCAVTANMGAMVANPRDLLQPRGETPADGDRRADVMAKYRRGEATAAVRGEGERGVVSNAVQ